jgi:serine/threonine-protein kinase HipA
VADELAVWLYGEQVATVARDRRGPRLTYSAAALERYELGTPLLALALPVAPRTYPQGVVRSYLDGLLPEGEARTIIARDVGESPSDTFGLIRALGRDCAGAIIIQPADDPSPPKATTTTAEPLTTDEIGDLVSNLRSAPLGAGGRVRLSLAGVQEKLVLTRMSNGEWGRPVDGTPSTHILKPEVAQFPATVENEAFCMRVAKHLGLEVANVETTEIAGRKLIVVERYDREVSTDGAVARIHQEDFCQALGIAPESKYEEDGGPSLAQIAGILATVATPDSLERLLAAVVVDVLVGNGDAHGKNFSLLHERSGALRLSPLYDLLCTLHYGDDRLAMYIDDVRRTNRVTMDRIVNEATRWGMGRRFVTDLITHLLEGADDAIGAAQDETNGVPPALISTIKEQLTRLKVADANA